jgi:hypothetical protein
MKEANKEVSPFSFTSLKQEEGQREREGERGHKLKCPVARKWNSFVGTETIPGCADYPWLCRLSLAVQIHRNCPLVNLITVCWR